MKKKSISVPRIEKAWRYIVKHHKRRIISAVNKAARGGELNDAFGRDVTKNVFAEKDIEFRQMDFWSLRDREVLIDLTLALWTGRYMTEVYGEMYITIGDDMEISFGEFASTEVRPERGLQRLSPYLVPYLGVQALEAEAEGLLKRNNCPDMKEGAYARACALAKNMGLTIRECVLKGRKRARSMLFYTEGTLDILDEQTQEYCQAVIPAGTIIINTSGGKNCNCAKAIFHECIHYSLHSTFCHMQRLYNTREIMRLENRFENVTFDEVQGEPLRWIEWQANCGAGALMMPQEFMSREVKKRIAAIQDLSHRGRVLDEVIRGIAMDYDIPVYCVKARLRSLGWRHAEGAANYVDGAYIEPFDFDSSKLEFDETLVIDTVGMSRLYNEDADFRKYIDSGYFIFLDGHIVLKDDRYIDKSNGRRLTRYANRHMDECCLRFRREYEHNDDSEYVAGVLNSVSGYNAHYFAMVAGKGGGFVESSKALLSVIENMPQDFGSALKYLMKQCGMTEEELALAAGLSVPTISRRKNARNAAYSAEQVVELCLAMHLPPIVSEIMLRLAGISLNETKKPQSYYKMILQSMYMDSMEEIQMTLKSLGCKQFKNDYEIKDDTPVM